MATLTDLTDTVWTFNGGITDIDWTALSRITSGPQLSFTANNDNFISFGYSSSQGLRYRRDYTVSNYVQVTDDNWNLYKTIHITGPVGTSSTQMVWNTSFIAWMTANATMHKRYFVEGDALGAVADAIRTKGGTSATLEFPTEFVSAIGAIHTEPNLQSKTASYTPTESAQTETISAESGYDGLDSVAVSVGAIPSNYVGSGITQRDSTDLSVSGATVTAPAGYYANAASKAVPDAVYTLGVDARPSYVGQDTYWRIKPSINVTTAGNVPTGEVIGDGGVSYPYLDATTVTPDNTTQTIGASGTYMGGAVTVLPAPANVTITQDGGTGVVTIV